MKAVVCNAYGTPDVLELKEIEKPIPKKDEVLIKIVATTVTAGDCELRRFDFPFLFWLPLRLYMGIFKPRINVLGQEFSGTIEDVGADVNTFKPGDKVFGPTDMNMGAYAEYRCLKSTNPISIKPDSISFEEAATIPTGGLNALHFINLIDINPGTQLLINGAGGSIGTYAIQIAKIKGAIVTAIDSSQKLEVLQSIGADHVFDYETYNYRKKSLRYDAIFDIVSRNWSQMGLRALKSHGTYLVANPGILSMLGSLWYKLYSKISRTYKGVKVINGLANYQTKELDLLKDLIESGKLTSVVDKMYPLEDLVQAHEYVDSGKKIGNVVISMPSS